MNNRTNRLTLSIILALGLLLVFATGIVLAQGPDNPDSPSHNVRTLPPITKGNVADFSIEELTLPEIWEQLSPREQRLILEAIEAGTVGPQEAEAEMEALANGVNLSLSIWETSASLYDPTYEPGSYFLYRIRLNNYGTDDATGVRLTYTPPPSVSVSGSFNDRAIPYSQNGDLVWDVGAVESGGDRNFYVEMRISPTATVGFNLVSTASVTCTQVMTPEQEVETDEVSGPTLDVDKRILRNSPGCLSCWGFYDTVKTDSEITYLVWVENESVITDAQNLVVTDTLPADVTFVSASDGGVYSATTHSVIWNAGALAKGRRRSFLLTVQTPPTASLSLQNVVTASASTDADSDSHQATTQALEPNVSVYQYYYDVPSPGNVVQLNIYVDNYGFWQQQIPVENVVATTTLEGGLEYVSSYVMDDSGVRDIAATTAVSGDKTTVTWELGALPNDPTGMVNSLGIYLQTRVPAGANGGDTFTATTAVTTTTQPESDTGDNKVQDIITALAPYPDLMVSKWGCSSPHPGGWCYYDLTVYNNGTVPITDAVLIDYLPVGLTAFGADDSDDYDPVVGDATYGPGTLSFASQVVTWTLKPIPPGGSVSVDLFVRVSDALAVGHTLTNTAIVTRTTIISDVNPGNNKVVDTTQVTADADLYVSKYGWTGSERAQPGDDVQYTAYLKNYSTVLAENTVMTDVVLYHASLVTATADEGIDPVVAGDVAVWDVGEFSGYPYPYFHVTTQVDSGLDIGQSFANLAWATTTSSQSDTDDNYDLDYDIVGILPQKSDVYVYKSLYGCPVPGGVVEFSIEVYNSSYTTATNVVVTDTLPVSLTYGGLDYYSGTTVTPTVSGQNAIWNLGDVSPGSSIYFEITATLSSALTPGDVLSNTVRVTAGNEDIEAQDDNVDYAQFVVRGSPYTDLSVYKEHDEKYIRSGSSSEWYIPLARRGQPFDYEIRVNYPYGTRCPAQDVIVRDVLPDGMTFVSASPEPTVRSGQVMTWNLGTLEYGSYIRVTVRPDAAAGEFLRNQVYVSSSTYDYDLRNNSFVFITGVNESGFVYLPLVLRDY